MRARHLRVVLVSASVAYLALVSGCKTAPIAPVTPPPAPPVPLDTRVAWILRLEQQRVLRDPGLVPGEAAPPAAATRLRPARVPDLIGLVNDVDPSVRRRAALALGRVGLQDGVPPLVAALGDDDEDVRATAAFALGLIGSTSAVEPLEAALKDQSLRVRGRAAEGLGLIGDPAAAPAVAAASTCRDAIAGIAPDDEGWPKSPDVDLCRLALFALVRLKNYEALASVALDDRGEPISRWWAVAYALQRIGDKRAVPALLALATTEGIYTPAFALRGLAAAKEPRATAVARAVAARGNADLRLRVAALRALGEIGGAGAMEALLTIARDKTAPRTLALEAVTSLGVLGDVRAFDPLLDMLTDSWPSMRAALLTSAAKVNPEGFLLVASGLAPDPDWSVRAALAGALATLPADQVRNEIIELTRDTDTRVQGPALRALASIGSPDLAPRLFEALGAQDYVVRATAADLVGQLRPPGGVERLTTAYSRGEGDAIYTARAAALASLAKYGTDDAKALLRRALADKAWPVRWKAADLLRSLGDVTAVPATPAPLREPPAFFESARLLHPTFSPHAFIETRAGTIEIELNLVEAPVTSQVFVDLARLGFFNGLKIHRIVPNFVIQGGDPRGDGEGGPGFTIMDELSPLPYVRGTVGMALDWRDTAGSQFFITVSPQPHLEARYTVFGRVVQGDQALDRLSQWDVIQRVRIWDGTSFQ